MLKYNLVIVLNIKIIIILLIFIISLNFNIIHCKEEYNYSLTNSSNENLKESNNFEFYINPLSNNTKNNNKAYPCLSKDNPCNNFCQAINYLNNFKGFQKGYVLVVFYLQNNFTGKVCQLKELDFIFKITIQGPLVSELNSIKTTIDFKENLVFFGDNVNVVTFKFLNIVDLKLFNKYNIEFYTSIVDSFVCKDNSDIDFNIFAYLCSFLETQIIGFSNINIFESTLQSTEIFNFHKLKIISTTSNSNELYVDYNLAIFKGEQLIISKCTFDVDSFVISTVKTLTVEETNFNNLQEKTSGAYRLDIRYIDNLKFINCNSMSEGEWLMIRGTKQIEFDNVNTRGSIEIVFTEGVVIKNSLFHDTSTNGLKLLDVSYVLVAKTNFTNCVNPLIIENSHDFYPSFTVDSCHFIRNSATQNGGAITGFSKTGTFTIKNSVFSNNFARDNGGALFLITLDNDINISDCIFHHNRVSPDIPFSNIKEGNGGAAYLIGNSIFSGVEFYDNVAIRGGALYTDFIAKSVSDTLFINNYASLSGSGVFSNNLQTLNVFENKLFANGTDSYKSSFTSKVETTFYVGNEEKEELIVFPGQVFYVILKPFDLLGNQINNFFEPMTIINPLNGNFILKRDFTQPNGITKFSVLQSPHFNFTSELYLESVELILPILKINIQLTVTKCPDNYVIERDISTNYLFCKPTEFPISVIIILTIIGTIFFLLVISIVGLIIIYTCFKVVLKLKKLELKEKAELEIEQKIIDKKIIFGDSVNSSLLQNDGLSKNSRKEEIPSFLIPVEEIKIQKKIGEGGCGTVYSAKWGENTVAIKSIKFSDNDDNEDFEREVSLLSTLRHPNIVTFYGVTITDTAKYMVIEYLSKGSLKQTIYNSKTGKEVLTLKNKLNILIGIAQGMNYLHTLKPSAIIHRDLKPENVLLDSNNNCKVCDFGLSKILGSTAQTMTTNIGTLFYLSPEMLKGDNPSSIKSKLDVYSFSIIMWELFFEENAYGNALNSSASSKLNYFKRDSYINNYYIENVFLIPVLVTKGLRPTIPFLDEKERDIWLNEFVIPFEKSNNVIKIEEIVTVVVENYLKLMKECWSENPNERPAFNEIILRLQEMKNSL